MRSHPWHVHLLILILAGTTFSIGGCGSEAEPVLTNFSHLDRLYQPVRLQGTEAAILRATAQPPDYEPVPTPDGRLASVQDAARGAIAYLWRAESIGDPQAVAKAEGLLRFVTLMQVADGRFVNWVDAGLNPISETRDASVFGRTTARAVWALGEGLRVLRATRPETAEWLWSSLRKTVAAIEKEAVPSAKGDSDWPPWLSDAGAAAEMLLGLVAARSAGEADRLTSTVEVLGEALLTTQAGDSTTFPHHAFLSQPGRWIGAGNAQADALCWAGQVLHRLDWFNAGFFEAREFYPYLLRRGPVAEFELSEAQPVVKAAAATPGLVRPAVHALLIVYGLTREQRFATYAGEFIARLLDGSGNGVPIYDSRSGRAYDGPSAQGAALRSASADAAVEALLALLPAEMDPVVRNAIHNATF